jgi:hypothetical protein
VFEGFRCGGCGEIASDFAKVMELLRFRPMQLALVLKTLVGADEMQRMMIEAIGMAKREE